MILEVKKNIEKILLVRPAADIIHIIGHPRDIRVPFLLKYIESLLVRDGECQTHFIDCMANYMDFDKLVKVSVEYSPDVIVLSPTTLEYNLSLEYAKLLKKKNNPIIIAIGQDATAGPERYVYNGSPVDILLKGECELSFIKLLRAINDNGDLSKIEGIFMRNYHQHDLAIVRNLDILPFPIYNGGEFRKYIFYYPLPIGKKVIWGHMLTSRGCPYNCIFCSQTIRESYGKEVRFREPSSVVDEMVYLKQKGVNIISFDDDNFTTFKSHVVGICEEIKNRGLKIMWSAHARIDNCDEDLLKIMKEAGCILLRFGIESGSEKIIKILKKTDDEDSWMDKAKVVFKTARKINLSTAALFLIGNPLETKKDIKKSISLAKELEPDLLQIHFFTPYPGSPAYEQFRDKISLTDIIEMYHYQASSLNFSQISTEELKDLYKKFYRAVLLSAGYILRHLSRYSLFYLHNRNIFLRLFNMRRLIF